MKSEYRGANVVWLILELFGHGIRHGERGCGPSAKRSLVVLGNFDEWMIDTSCSGQNCPSIVMPINYQVCIAKETDDYGDQESRNRRRVLDQKPPGWFGGVPQSIEQCPYLPQNFQRPGEDEWKGFRAEDGRWG